MGIQSEGVRAFYSGESRLSAFGQLEKPSIRAVDVHPQAGLSGEVGNLGEGVDGSRLGRTGGGDDQEGLSAVGSVGIYELAEVGNSHSQLVVHIDHRDLVGAEPRQASSLGC